MKSLKSCFNVIFILCFLSSVNAQIPAGYYDGALNKSGDDLKVALNDIISGHTEYPYSESSTDTWDILKDADRDPNNSSNILTIYSGFSIDAAGEYNNGNGWNREHVWPRSRGDFTTSDGVGTDCHNLRASDISTNSARSNRNFDECSVPYFDNGGVHNGSTPSFSCSTGFVWRPGDDVIGDIARTIFYMATRYEGENGEPDLELTETLQGQSDKAPVHARLSTLLAWHAEDPVSDAERARNEVIYGFQGNRNPFIDHPEYVTSIWGGDTTPTPVVNVTSSLENFGSVSFGSVSEIQSYTVSGADLTGNLTITSNNGFEVSLTQISGDFSTSLTLSPTAGDLSNTTIYVRFKPQSDSNGSVTGAINHTSSGAVTQTIAVSGSEAIANIVVTSSLQDFGGVNFGEVSGTQSYTVSGTGLSFDITVTSNNGFEISLTDVDQDFSSSLTLSQTAGEVTSTTVYIRFKPQNDSNGSVSGTVTHTSTGAVTREIAVSGSERGTTNIDLTSSLQDFGGIKFGEVSEIQSYTVSGSGLTSDIQITSNNGFEVSLTETDQDFSSSLTLGQTAGEVASTTIYVRFKPESDLNDTVTGTITHTATGAVTQEIVVSGSEAVATIVLTSSLQDFGGVNFGEVSATQSYTISGSDLAADIIITTNNGFEVSLTGTDQDFSSSLTLSQTDGEVASTTVYVRFKPESDLNDTVTGTITHTTTGASTQTINLSGSELLRVVPEVNFSFTSRLIQPSDEYEVQLFSDIAPNTNLTIQIERTNGTGLVYDQNYTTTPASVNDVLELVWQAGALSASFVINFETDLLDATDPGNLMYSISTGNDYAVGTNKDFELTLKGEEDVVIANISNEIPKDLTVYPNPSNGQVTVAWKGGAFNYSIMDLAGKLLKNGNAQNVKVIDTSELKLGHYVLRVSDNQKQYSHRLIIL